MNVVIYIDYGLRTDNISYYEVKVCIYNSLSNGAALVVVALATASIRSTSKLQRCSYSYSYSYSYSTYTVNVPWSQ